MAQEYFNLNVYTPGGVLLKESTSEVTMPTAMGEIGVLPGHAPYTGILADGRLSYVSSVSKKSISVSGGFASFSSGTLNVLADQASAEG